MNPLDLRGPEFLLFYLFFAAAVLVALHLVRRRRDPGGTAPGRLTDPYRIAYLRGGEPEMLRVAAAALVDRGLLRVERDQLVALPGEPPDDALERAVVARFDHPRPARDLYEPGAASAIALAHREALERQGLLPDAEVVETRWRAASLAIVLLAGLAGTKIVVALGRGHTNVGFLVVLAAAAIGTAAKLGHPRLTVRGAQLLEDLRHLFAGLQARPGGLRPGGATQDAVLLAAVFGTGALAAVTGFEHLKTLFPQASAGGGSWGSSCGSGGSSCGGGGGCGGGGCGGCGG